MKIRAIVPYPVWVGTRNQLLVKVLQNDQKDSWAQAWAFALRVCDATGGKLPLTQVVAKDGVTTTVPLGNLKAESKKEAK